MKMMSKGNVKLSMYRVYYRDGEEHHDFYIQATTAQEAVNTVREDGDDIEIIDVAKVVNNWK